MGWRGAGGNGAANVGVYFGFGGVLMLIGSVGEVSDDSFGLPKLPRPFYTLQVLTSTQWIIGNTFPFVVFGTFGAFWLTFGFTLVPMYNAAGAYASDPITNPVEGLQTTGFNSTFGKQKRRKKEKSKDNPLPSPLPSTRRR